MNQAGSREQDWSDPRARGRRIAALLGDRKTNDDARRLLLTATAVLVIFQVVFRTTLVTWLRVPIAYALPALLLYPLLLAALLYLRGRAVVPRRAFAAGVVLTVGGIAFERIATAIETATAGQEGHPITLALLDAGHPALFVYWYAIIAHGLYAAFLCLLWGAFLRHRLTLLVSAHREGAKGRPAFLKAALGGGHLSWLRFLCPVRPSELPTSFHLLWLGASTLAGTGLYRIYLGLCRLGVCPFAYAPTAEFLTGVLGLGAYLAWLLAEADKRVSRVEGGER